uniref:NADH-ubiquinone oxidoreductase chain 6 n=1 Tax=Spizellomyces punctatus TaxID=109760 RepID=Q950S1_SPIPN|nr:NADH dehydrogenase subunit 6 [Spizellomyces punctatus]AAK84237.1 NADH dehydrogenase subunit 6 [Spizellomyces punctatus]
MSYICYVYYLIGITGLLSALVVASSLNPIHRIAFLILVFLSGSFLMIILDFYFLGLTYIIVYVGAIMILFLFVIMMVQIHLMPVTLSVTPRIISSSNYTGGLSVPTIKTNGNNQLSLVLDNEDVNGNNNSTDLALTLAMDSSNKNGGTLVSDMNGSMALAMPTTRTITLSNSTISAIRNLVLALLFILSLVFLMRSSLISHNLVVTYFFPAWSIEFKTMTDLETLANILYVGYPTALILISVALWVVMIGIIKVTMSEKA